LTSSFRSAVSTGSRAGLGLLPLFLDDRGLVRFVSMALVAVVFCGPVVPALVGPPGFVFASVAAEAVAALGAVVTPGAFLPSAAFRSLDVPRERRRRPALGSEAAGSAVAAPPAAAATLFFFFRLGFGSRPTSSPGESAVRRFRAVESRSRVVDRDSTGNGWDDRSCRSAGLVVVGRAASEDRTFFFFFFRSVDGGRSADFSTATAPVRREAAVWSSRPLERWSADLPDRVSADRVDGASVRFSTGSRFVAGLSRRTRDFFRTFFFTFVFGTPESISVLARLDLSSRGLTVDAVSPARSGRTSRAVFFR